MLKTMLGRCIYQSSSGLKVFQNPWYRWLSFNDDDLQTVLRRAHPERPGLHYIPPLIRMVLTSPGNCCLLGLGGAGIPHALYPSLATKRILAIELNSEVIEVAERYFMTDRIKNLKILNQNAFDFIQTNTDIYQHLIIDLHNGKTYPEACGSEVFFEHCKRSLAPAGMLTINLININKQTQLVECLKKIFHPCILVVPIPATANTLVFAFHLSERLFLETIQTMPFLKMLQWDPFWSWVGKIAS